MCLIALYCSIRSAAGLHRGHYFCDTPVKVSLENKIQSRRINSGQLYITRMLVKRSPLRSCYILLNVVALLNLDYRVSETESHSRLGDSRHHPKS